MINWKDPTPEQLEAFEKDPEAFKRFGCAPGNYLPRCRSCNETFTGDKRATCCFDCAEKFIADYKPEPEIKIDPRLLEVLRRMSVDQLAKELCEVQKIVGHVFKVIYDHLVANPNTYLTFVPKEN